MSKQLFQSLDLREDKAMQHTFVLYLYVVANSLWLHDSQLSPWIAMSRADPDKA